MRIRSMCAAAVALAALALSGCGGGGSSPNPSNQSSSQSSSFVASFRSTTGQFKQLSIAIGAAIQQSSSETDAQIGSAFRGLASRWQDTLSRLETLNPPSNVATTFNTLKSAISRAESDLNALVAAAGTHSASAAQQASASLVNDIKSAKSAAQMIDQKLRNT